MSWTLFRCNSCGWETPGHYNFNNDPDLDHMLPDTDCPKCGSHDGVVDTDQEVPEPRLRGKVFLDINTGPFVRSGPVA